MERPGAHHKECAFSHDGEDEEQLDHKHRERLERGVHPELHVVREGEGERHAEEGKLERVFEYGARTADLRTEQQTVKTSTHSFLLTPPPLHCPACPPLSCPSAPV
eukprot:768335-Hanusia_phi.AAC.5